MRIGCIGTTKMETKINYIWNPKLFEKILYIMHGNKKSEVLFTIINKTTILNI